MKVLDESGDSLGEKLVDLSDDLTEALEELNHAGRDYAKKDNEYRKVKAVEFLSVEGKNKEEREAKADAKIADKRLECFLAEQRKEWCLEKVRSLRAQLSALQALVYSQRAEREAIGYRQIQRT